MDAAPEVVLGVGGGILLAKYLHNRKKGADKPFDLGGFEHRINQAAGEAREQGEDLAYGGRPGGRAGSNSLQVGPRAFQVGGKESERVWLDLTLSPGFGFGGPGAHGVLRCSWISILLSLGGRPPGRVVIPEPDAVRLLGTTRPDPVPENLYVVADVEHALAALEAEIEHRFANRALAPTLPLVVLMLAEPPADPDKAAELAELLRTGHHLGVTALMGGDWPAGASIDIDANHDVTATRGWSVAHLDGAHLFSWPAARLVEVCKHLDNANRAAAQRAASAAPDTTPAAGDPANVATEPDTTTTSAAPTPPAPAEVQPSAPTLDHQPPTPEATGDYGAPDTANAHGTDAAARSASSPAEPPSSQPCETEPAARERGVPATAHSGEPPEPATTAPVRAAVAPDASVPPASTDNISGQDPMTQTRHSGSHGLVCRLELVHTPRLMLISPDADTPPINITPPGRVPIRVLVKLALERGPQRRTAVAAAMWPATNIDRPTNTFNSYRTRIRQFIQKETNGAITDLIQDYEDGTCELRPDLFQVDYWEFLDAIDPHSTPPAPERARAYLKALAGYKGDFAGNIDDDWITEYRNNAHQQALKAAINLAYELTKQHDDPVTAVTVLDQALAFDPLHEPIYQHIIKLLLELGRRDAAIQRYKTLERELDRQLGVKPLPETMLLLRQ